MIFHGFQKMTLLDFPGRVACTLFTGGCNFRCPFCHNASLVTDIDNDVTYTEESILAFLDKRHGLLDGVAITGGEPLMHESIADFIVKVREKGFAVKLDTNGSFPDRLRDLIDRGLVDYVAMDVKNCREKYALTAGIDASLLPKIEESMALLLEGRVDYEFRTTVINEFHTPEDIGRAAAWIGGAKRYFLQPFVDSGNLIGDTPMSAPDADTLCAMREAAAPHVPATAIRGAD